MRSRENLQKWRPAAKLIGHGAVFLEIGLHALDRKCHANCRQAIDLLFCHFPTPCFGILTGFLMFLVLADSGAGLGFEEGGPWSAPRGPGSEHGGRFLKNKVSATEPHMSAKSIRRTDFVF